MRIKWYYIVIMLIVAALVSCEEPYDLEASSKRYYVVDGRISNQGSYVVVAWSSGYSSDPTPPEAILDALVQVVDRTGNTVTFTSSNTNIYTPSIPFTVDSSTSYQLHIEIGEDVIESTFEEQPTGVLFSLGATRETREVFNGAGSIVIEEGALVTAKIESDTSSYVKWEFIDQYKDPSSNGLVTNFHNDEFIITSGIPFEDSLDVAYLPRLSYIPGQEDDSPVAVSVVVTAQSITSSTYHFWQLVRTQQDNSGGIFDNIPAIIEGNLNNTTGTSGVLGYFYAANVTRDTIILIRN